MAMSYQKNTPYIKIPFSPESSCTEFFKFSNLRDLATKCEISQNIISRCRAVGILQSVHGKFYLVELDSEARKYSPHVRLSFVYLKSPLPSTVLSYPVQVFGVLQWKNRPVIYVNFLQVLNVPIALKVHRAMDNIVNIHLAASVDDEEEYSFSEWI